jgi:hypothetical protein
LPAGLAHLQPLLDGLLAKKPADRFATAADIVATIDAVLKSAAA